MFIVDLPCANADLAPGGSLTMRHDLLNLHTGLESGQLLYGLTDDGDHWGIEVTWVRLDRHHTTYRFRIGARIDRALVGMMEPVRLSRGQHGTGDVRAALRLLGWLDRDAVPCTDPAHTHSGRSVVPAVAT